jgi:hypothetical protein
MKEGVPVSKFFLRKVCERERHNYTHKNIEISLSLKKEKEKEARLIGVS